MTKSKLSAPQRGFLNALNACVLGAALLLPQQTAGRQQSSAPAREQKKPEPEQQEKAKPTPPREAKTPVKRLEEKTPEKSPPEQTQQPAPTQPREGKDSRPPAPEKQEGGKEAQPPAAGAPTPAQAEKAKETPTVEPAAAAPSPTPTAQPTPTARPSPAIEERPAQVRTTDRPIQEATPQPAQGQAGAPSPVTTPPAAGADRAQWSFRRELEALAQTFSFGKILLSLLFLLLGYFANKLVALLAARASARRNVYAEWLRRVTPFVSFGLWFAIALAIVQIFTQSLFALALLSAAAALALAFASQPLLRDMVGGLVILFERPFRLGDHIAVGDHQGEVKEIGLRAFQLASSNGALIAVPNAAVLRQPVVNASPGMVEGRVTIDLPLPEGIDLEHAKRIAFEAAILSPYACIHKPVEVYADEQRQNDMRARIIIHVYVFDARYERQLRSDAVERARRVFQSLRRVTSDTQGRLD